VGARRKPPFGSSDREAPHGVRHSIVLPPFIVRDADAMLRLGRLPPHDPDDDDLLVMKIGRGGLGLLAAVFEDGSAKDVSFHYSPSPAEGYAKPTDENGDWDADPFLDLLDTISEWAGSEAASDADSVVHSLDFGRDGTQLRELAHSMQAAVRAVLDTSSAGRPPTRWGGPRLGLDRLHGSVVLRLNPDGDLAKDDSEDPFHLRISYTFQRDQRAGRLTARVDPPDFLSSGPLLAEFRSLIESAGFAEVVREVLGWPHWPVPRIDTLLGDILRSGRRGETLVFRVRRERKYDENVIIVRGGESRVWMLRARFVVTAGDEDGSFEVRYAGRFAVLYAGDEDRPRVHRDVARYFKRLCAGLRDWSEVI
jgi:hypothetical protein